MNNNFIKMDETNGMRIVEHKMNKKQRLKVTVFEYIMFVFLFVVFLLFVLCILAFLFRAISDYSKGNDFGAAWHLAWCVMGSPGFLLFGLPTFFMGRNIVKYHKIKKKYSEITIEDNCVPAIVSKIDYIDHAYAKDEYWLVCDVIHEANHTIYRYESEKVKGDLFLKFKEGDRIAVYIHPEDPEDYYVDLSAVVSESDLSNSNIAKIYKAENNQIDIGETKDDENNDSEIKNKKYYETDDATGMRIVKRQNALVQKSRFALVAEWVALICFAILFMLIIGCIIIGGGTGIKIYNAGVLELSTIIAIGCIYAVPLMLLFGSPLFFLCRSKIKYPRRVKMIPEWCSEENRIWATVKIIDFIDYKYAKDEFWVVCDDINNEENIVNRYTSQRVKEDLFAKVEPGQQIAVYVNPDNPDNYYVNLDEIK